MPGKDYNEQSIQILKGLDAVRKRPGMYIGSTDYHGLHHLVWEIMDNAMDEALNGFGKVIKVTIEKNNVICVEDEGRGMPMGKHASGVPTIQVIFTELHAGAKFSSDSGYKTAGGLHGVGASVVNALSEWLEVTTCYKGGIYRMTFKNGGSVISKLERKNVKEEFCYENGLEAFIKYLHEGREGLSPIVTFSGGTAKIGVDFAFQYTDGVSENSYSFVNHVRTVDGGTHVVGYKTAFTKCFNDYARRTGLLKDKDENLEGGDIREGLTAVVSLTISEDLLEFEGQTKGKLGTPEARNIVESVISDKLSFFLQENKEMTDGLIRKMIRALQARKAAQKAREEVRNGKGKNQKRERQISGKLAPAQSRNSKKNELFLVEGDSAGGSAKQGRDSKYQAILPLRGKVLNTEKASEAEILKNEELSTLIYTIGADFGAKFDVESSNYDKVIIMTDADTDGAHIQVLLLTFFYRYMKPLIDAGKVYVALPPLYKVQKGKEVHYAYNDDELEELREKYGKVEIQRYKGLGEMNADQLWDTTMNPETRTLIQVSIDDNFATDKKFNVLMGDRPDIRREWIEDFVTFTLEDKYQLEGN